MKIWLSKNSEVPVRDQLITQIVVAILSDDLHVGDKLPSTREIARRFQIHANTVSTAYQKLADDGWLEFRKGSGFYIREADPANIDRELQLERLVSDLFESAVKLGFSPRDVRDRILRRADARPADHILVIESDAGLRDIIVGEISEACGREVRGIDRSALSDGLEEKAAVFAAMMDEKPKIEGLIPPGEKCVYLKARSVSDSMAGQARPSRDDLIAVVSGWGKFLLMAKTILVAADIDSGSLIVRQTDEAGWKRGLASSSMIICDSLTARHFPKAPNVRPFRIVSDESLAEIKSVLCGSI
jgi:DNA-binding transcriptional regulator YhcF (GntR family)